MVANVTYESCKHFLIHKTVVSFLTGGLYIFAVTILTCFGWFSLASNCFYNQQVRNALFLSSKFCCLLWNKDSKDKMFLLFSIPPFFWSVSCWTLTWCLRRPFTCWTWMYTGQIRPPKQAAARNIVFALTAKRVGFVPVSGRGHQLCCVCAMIFIRRQPFCGFIMFSAFLSVGGCFPKKFKCWYGWAFSNCSVDMRKNKTKVFWKNLWEAVGSSGRGNLGHRSDGIHSLVWLLVESLLTFELCLLWCSLFSQINVLFRSDIGVLIFFFIVMSFNSDSKTFFCVWPTHSFHGRMLS